MGLANSISLQEENEEEEEEDDDDDDEEEEEEEEEAEGNGEVNLMQETPNIATYEEMEKQQYTRAALGHNPNNQHRIFKNKNGNGNKNRKDFSAPKLDISGKLEQDPEMVPFESSASPVSLVSTPHLSNSMIRVWDPSHILNPNVNGRIPVSFTSDQIVGQSLDLHAPTTTNVSPARTEDICTEIYLIRHAESSMNTFPELIGGRSPSATVTPDGRREARALGVFLLSHGLHFDAVFSSSLERCKQTAVAVCQEVNFARDKIEFSDALVELSQGQWEGLRRSDVYTPELLNVIANSQPDFHAPGGESQRQVEFRMIEFLNNVILPRAIEVSLNKDTKLPHAMKPHTKTNPLMQVHPLNYDEEYDETKAAHGVLIPSSIRTYSSNSSHAKTSGKSRLRIASSDQTANMVMDMAQGEGADTGHSEEKVIPKPSPYSVAVFSHGMAIKCLLRGILGSDPRMTHRLTIDNTSMTVLRHSTYTGWQVLRVNDTAHLRLL